MSSSPENNHRSSTFGICQGRQASMYILVSHATTTPIKCGLGLHLPITSLSHVGLGKEAPDRRTHPSQWGWKEQDQALLWGRRVHAPRHCWGHAPTDSCPWSWQELAWSGWSELSLWSRARHKQTHCTAPQWCQGGGGAGLGLAAGRLPNTSSGFHYPPDLPSHRWESLRGKGTSQGEGGKVPGTLTRTTTPPHLAANLC